MKYFKKLEGERIYLSPRNLEDTEIFTKWLNDFSTTDYLGRSGMLVSKEGEQEYLEKNKREQGSFCIVTIDNNQMIGSISLENINNINRCATLGIFIGEKDFLSKGYGTEAIKLILDYGFNYLNLHSIRLDVYAFNERAIKCYRKCGFKEYGTRRQCKYVNGKYHDVIEMDMLKSEFLESYIKNKEI